MIDLTLLFPKAQGGAITIEDALSTDGFIEYRRNYSAGKVRWGRSAFDRQCLTITKTGLGWKTFIGNEYRSFTEAELKLLASFPSAFEFQGERKEAWERIGNSVPPLFMYAIAAQIRHIMFSGPAIEKRMIDYPAHLAAMWQKAIAPREPDAPTVVSTFAGGGGSLTGYLMAGYRDLLAVEWDDNAVATLRANYPDLDIYHGDIAKLTVEEVLKRTGLEPGQLDILDGSPPCQGFSTAGKRQMDDPRNQLFREYVRLLRGLRPKVFVMENVSGMVKGKMKLVFVEILKELKASGYRVSAKLLNAMYFHVPQSRERMIFIGVRDDLGIEPTHPRAEGKPIAASTAIPGLIASRAQRINPCFYSWPPAATICKMNEGYQALIISNQEIKEASIAETWQAHRVLSGIEAQKPEVLLRLNPGKPSPTITKDAGNTTTGLIHPYEIRKMTIPEIKRLASFPDEYRIDGRYKEKWACIGNSVPPLFMEAIARHIRREILEATT